MLKTDKIHKLQETSMKIIMLDSDGLCLAYGNLDLGGTLEFSTRE